MRPPNVLLDEGDSICWALSLASIARKKQPLTFVAPAPILLANGTKTVVENHRVVTALAWVVGLIVGRALSLACVAREEHALTFVAPTPLALLGIERELIGTGVDPRSRLAEIERVFSALG